MGKSKLRCFRCDDARVSYHFGEEWLCDVCHDELQGSGLRPWGVSLGDWLEGIDNDLWALQVLRAGTEDEQRELTPPWWTPEEFRRCLLTPIRSKAD